MKSIHALHGGKPAAPLAKALKKVSRKRKKTAKETPPSRKRGPSRARASPQIEQNAFSPPTVEVETENLPYNRTGMRYLPENQNVDGSKPNPKDDARLKESCLRPAPPRALHDFKVNVDPSFPSNQIKENEPPQGQIAPQPPGTIHEDDTLQQPGNRMPCPDPDDVSARTDTRQEPPLNEEKKGLARPVDKKKLPLSHREGPRQPGGDAMQNLLGQQYSPNEDAIGNTPTGYDPKAPTNTLRPLYGLANPMSVVPTTREQIKSNLLFADFHIIAPGHGLGATNKLYLMNEMREEKIRFHQPLSFPRTSIGPTNGVLAPPIEWQNEIPQADLRRILFRRAISMGRKLAVQDIAGHGGSLNILGDDFGLLRKSSMKGLPRPAEIPYEPIYLKPHAPERVRPLAGIQLQGKQERRLFDALRYPEHFESHMGQDGGSTYSRQKAL